jgi:hypothetical protein
VVVIVQQAGQVVGLVGGDDQQRVGGRVREVAQEGFLPLAPGGVFQFRRFATRLHQAGDAGAELIPDALEHVRSPLIFGGIM